MKKIVPIVIIGIMLFSVIGASANTTQEILSNYEAVDSTPATSEPTRDYTHTVFVEVGTATWCPSCPGSNTAWHNIYNGGNYDFEYTELVYDKNNVASSRFNQFNPKYVPTSYWDGGQFALPGTNTGTFYNYLDQSGARAVPDIVAQLNVTWLTGTAMEINYSVMNNEGTNYPGYLRIYVIELESTLWNDYSGNPYYHAFLDFAENTAIDIPATDSISDTITWDGASNGFPGITKNNIQVILAVFDDAAQTGYSDPPSGNPFNAYYSDECIAALPTGGTNSAPDTPHIEGKVNGAAGTEYTYSFCTEDPDGDDIYYWVDWGDGCPAVEWLGPFPSGVCTTITHTFEDQGDFTIRAKAKDINDLESDWGYLDISMPMNYQAPNWFYQILMKYPQAFPILRTLLGL